jgi:hypothetical protein
MMKDEMLKPLVSQEEPSEDETPSEGETPSEDTPAEE